MIDIVVGTIGGGALLLGLGVATIGLYGMLRHPDVFEQLHAAGLVTGAGVILVLLASLASGSAEIITSAFLVAVFILVTSSLSTHVVALAAWRGREASGGGAGHGVAGAASPGDAAPAPMRVLLAYDGSPSSDMALALAASLSWPDGSVARVIGVTEGDLPPLADAVGPGGSTDRGRDGPAIALAAAVRGLERPGLVAEYVRRGGDPVTAILNEAEALGADLVVMGSRGLGALRSMLTGSVASGVLDQAPCPVLVARAPQVDRVVLATDGSAASDAATEALATWPIFEGLDIRVLSVARLAEATSRQRTIAEAAVARLDGMGRRAAPFVRVGDEASRITHFAEEQSADLIVLGSRGHTGLVRTLLGSVARGVLASTPASVVVVRSGR